jgi:hypothetical protein
LDDNDLSDEKGWYYILPEKKNEDEGVYLEYQGRFMKRIICLEKRNKLLQKYKIRWDICEDEDTPESINFDILDFMVHNKRACLVTEEDFNHKWDEAEKIQKESYLIVDEKHCKL